jgi:hypothetical protein
VVTCPEAIDCKVSGNKKALAEPVAPYGADPARKKVGQVNDLTIPTESHSYLPRPSACQVIDLAYKN